MSTSAELLLLLLFYFIDDLTICVHTMPTVMLSDIISKFQTAMLVIADIQTVFYTQCVDSSLVTTIKSKRQKNFALPQCCYFTFCKEITWVKAV